MTELNRRKLLRDLGLVTASLAVPWPIACKCAECSDLYVILEGPWVLSIRHPLYIRAITTHMGGHMYWYCDPRSKPDDGADRDLSNTRMMHFDVKPHCDHLVSEHARKRLFNAMRDQGQGIFFKSDVNCPDVFGCSPNPHEIQFSYPDEIFPMALQKGVIFSNLKWVENQNLSQWPSALILRYKRWKSALFFGDNIQLEQLNPTAGGRHRKIGVGVPLVLDSSCNMDKRAAQNAVDHFNSVMKLLQFPDENRPVPAFGSCSGDADHIKDQIELGGNGAIRPEELGDTPRFLKSTLRQGQVLMGSSPGDYHPFATELVNCAAGGGGIVDH